MMIQKFLKTNIKPPIKGGTLIEVLQVILRKTLLKKGSSSNSFPKTFSIKFSPDRALHTRCENQ